MSLGTKQGETITLEIEGNDEVLIQHLINCWKLSNMKVF